MYKKSEKLRDLGEKVIHTHIDLLSHIIEQDIYIEYLECDEKKVKDGRRIYADCEKVKPKYEELVPYDFIITFYGETPEGKEETLMLHELLHVGWEDGKAKIRPHDVQDFKIIVDKLGTDWMEG